MRTEQPKSEIEGEVWSVKQAPVIHYLPFQGDISVVVLCSLLMVSEFR